MNYTKPKFIFLSISLIFFFSKNLFSQTIPTAVNGLALWIDADSVELFNTQYVKKCFDKSGNNNHATQFVNTKMPQQNLVPEFNLHKSLKFDGIDDFLKFPQVANIRSVFWVIKEDPNASFNAKPLLGDSLQYHFYRSGAKFFWDQNNVSPFIKFGQLNVNYQQTDGLVTTVPTQYSIVSLVTTGNVQAEYFGNDRNVASHYWHGELAELIVYNQPLDSTQVENIEKYLENKYAPPVNIGPDISLLNSFCDTVLKVPNYVNNYSWGNGHSNNALPITNSGTYYIQSVNVFNQTSFDTVHANITRPPNISFNDTIICGKNYLANTGLNNSDFDFLWSDGSTDSVLLITQNDFYFTLIKDAYGCTKLIDTFHVTIDDFPITASLGNDTSFCGPNYLKLKNGFGQAISFIWYNSSNNDSVLINNSGMYWLNAISTNGCQLYDTINITINPLPQFSLGNDTGICYPNKVVLDPGLNNCNILWQDNSNNPTFNANSNGFFWAKATDSLGCSFTDTISISIDTTLKHASLGPDTSLCSGSFIYLNGITSNNGINFLWSDNSTNSNLQVSGGGIYWIKAVNNNGCSLKDSIDITISGIAPLVSFAANNNCFGTPNNFINFSTAANGDSILGYSWNFGDGTSDTTYSPNHIFQDTGYFFVNLDIKTLNGCQASKSDTIHVFPNPSANFSTSNSFCSNTPVIFTDSSQTYGYPISALTWNFGDPGSPNNNSNSIIASHLFSSSGPYQISMIVIDVNGCSDSLAKNLTILPSPIADFNFGPACETEKTQFFDISNLQGLQALNYYWNFSGTEVDSTNSVEFIFTDTGTYTVKHIILATNGCSDTTSKNILINPKPISNFSYSGICIGDTLFLTDSSLVNSGTINNWNWLIQNSPISSFQNHFLIADSAGQYNIKLIAKTDKGCSDTSSKFVTIHSLPTPIFSFSPNEGILPLDVTFTNQTSGNNTYNWNFGDSNFSNSTNPFHQYTDTGKFEITLNTTSEYGCVSKITDSVRVYEPRLDISAINLEFQEVNNFIKITGYFKNEGNLTVNNLDLYAKVDGGSFFKELWSGTIIKNGILVHEFSSQVYNPNEGTYLCVEATIPNQSIEINLSNNQFCSNMGENNFSVYNLFPNPSVNELNIPFNLTKKGIVYFSMYSAGGNLVRKFEFNAETPGIQITKMDISDLSSGIYGLNIEFEGKNIVKKILKQKKD